MGTDILSRNRISSSQLYAQACHLSKPFGDETILGPTPVPLRHFYLLVKDGGLSSSQLCACPWRNKTAHPRWLELTSQPTSCHIQDSTGADLHLLWAPTWFCLHREQRKESQGNHSSVVPSSLPSFSLNLFWT